MIKRISLFMGSKPPNCPKWCLEFYLNQTISLSSFQYLAGAKINPKPYTSRFLLHFSWMPWSNFNFFVAFGFSIRRSSPTRHLSKHFPLRNLQGCYPKFSSHICTALHLSLPPRNNDWFRGPALCSVFNQSLHCPPFCYTIFHVPELSTEHIAGIVIKFFHSGTLFFTTNHWFFTFRAKFCNSTLLL